MILAEDLFTLGNHIEAVFWILIALVCAGYAFRRVGVPRQRCLQAAVVLAAFGFSDIVEVQTGAWWKPWWLFVWKAVCVLALLALLMDHWRRTHANDRAI